MLQGDVRIFHQTKRFVPTKCFSSSVSLDERLVRILMVQWCNALNEEHDKRFPEGGIKTEAYAMGNLLDPQFRDSFLTKEKFQKRNEDLDLIISNERDALVKKIIEEHTSTKACNDRFDIKNSVVNAELQSPEMEIDESLRMYLDEMAFPTGPKGEDHQPP